MWINHAPRGTVQEPLNFDRLLPFNAAADILSMDVYPVPTGSGHVLLPDGSDGLASVGRYVDILYSLAREHGRQARPIWMVPQGFGWPDLIRDSPQDAGDTKRSHTGMALEVHWLDENGSLVTTVGPDGVAGKVVSVLQTPRPNEWFPIYEQRLQPPPQARTAVVLLRTYGPGTYWFDDITFGEEGGSSLLVNGSFEEGTGDSPTGWARSQEAGSTALSWDDSRVAVGSRSVRTDMYGGGQADWRQYVPVDPTKHYRFGGRLYAQIRPTWEQTRFMAYNALIHGARGLSWYGNHHLPSNSQLWVDLKRMAGELAVLSPALVSPAPFRTVSVSSTWGVPAETLLLQRGPELYLIVANPSWLTDMCTVRVDGLPLTSIERLFEPWGPSSLQDNSFTDSFGPFQVRVYRLR